VSDEGAFPHLLLTKCGPILLKSSWSQSHSATSLPLHLPHYFLAMEELMREGKHNLLSKQMGGRLVYAPTPERLLRG